MSINSVCLSGNLTRDMEIRNTQSGSAVGDFSIAVNDRWKNSKTGEWEDYTSFIDCTMFGNRVNNISKYLTKGMRVTICGKLRQNRWERDGQKRSKVEVIVDDVDFTNTKPSETGSYSAPKTTADESSSAYDEDIPF